MAVERSLDAFFTNISGKSNEIMDVDNNIVASGDFRKLLGIDAIIKRINNLFLISESTYFFDPTLGTGLYKYIFEPVDIQTKNNIESAIRNIIQNVAGPEINIGYEVLFFKNKKGFRINMTISYRGEKKSVSLDIDETILKTIK